MAVSFNHTIIQSSDKKASARFLTEILGLPARGPFGHFAIVQVGETSLDFAGTDEEISPRTSRFSSASPSSTRSSSAYVRAICDTGPTPYRKDRDRTNHRDGGRSIDFGDPDGHVLEVITRPYGSGAQNA